MKVFLHTKDSGKPDWNNTEFEFAQLPRIGEYIVLSPNSEYYQVKLVVHTPYEKGSFDAEVWATEISYATAMKQAIGEITE